MNNQNNDWQDVIEWELIDSTPDMVLGDPILEQQQKLREERRKVEEADHELTEELFSNLKEQGNKIIQKIKTSGKHVVDKAISQSKNKFMKKNVLHR